MAKGFDAKRVMSGKWGEVWYDGEYLAELISCKIEVNYKIADVIQVQKMTDGKKITGIEGKGELKFHHINSTVMKKEHEAIKAGKTPTHTIISGIDDPDAIGAERVTCYNCLLDKIILADFEADKLSERAYSFTFDDWDLTETAG